MICPYLVFPEQFRIWNHYHSSPYQEWQDKHNESCKECSENYTTTIKNSHYPDIFTNYKKGSEQEQTFPGGKARHFIHIIVGSQHLLIQRQTWVQILTVTFLNQFISPWFSFPICKIVLLIISESSCEDWCSTMTMLLLLPFRFLHNPYSNTSCCNNY